VVANRFDLHPLYFTYVNMGETVEYKLEIKNEELSKIHPSVIGPVPNKSGLINKDLNIQEAYSTESYLKLLWPNRTPVDSSMQ